MKSVIAFYLKFTGKDFSSYYKVLSMVPGFVIFLILSPWIIFQIAAFLSKYIPLSCPPFLERLIMAGSFFSAMILMTWALVELWTKGKGTPAPIAPTQRLVTSGPYRWCRNPIELGTNLYFLALGIFFDSLITGLFCMLLGLVLGIAYIKVIEEKEMLVRFGKPYDDYLHRVSFMLLPSLFPLNPEKAR